MNRKQWYELVLDCKTNEDLRELKQRYGDPNIPDSFSLDAYKAYAREQLDQIESESDGAPPMSGSRDE